MENGPKKKITNLGHNLHSSYSCTPYKRAVTEAMRRLQELLSSTIQCFTKFLLASLKGCINYLLLVQTNSMHLK